MKDSKKKKLEAAGWAVGSASDFLQLTDAEETLVAMKLALAGELKETRKKKRLTQQQLASQIGSSQSRVAKMEVADQSVSLELVVKSLVSLGADKKRIGKVIAEAQ